MRFLHLAASLLSLAGSPAALSSQATQLVPRFVENQGQVDEAVEFVSRHGDVSAFFTKGGFTLVLSRWESERPTLASCADMISLPDVASTAQGVCLKFELERASATRPEGLVQAPGRYSFFRGGDKAHWVTDARAWERLRYSNLRPGIDLEFRWSEGLLEYDFVLGSGSSPEEIALRCEGADGLWIGEDGALVAQTPLGELRQPPPVVEVWRGGTSVELPGRFRLLGEKRFGFTVPGLLPGESCRIDPLLEWSSLLGGAGEEQGVGVVLDSMGCPIATGATASFDFPDTAGIVSAGGDWDVFVTRLSPDGTTVLYSAVFGGSFAIDPDTQLPIPGRDVGIDVTVDPSGKITLIGLTGSEDFPVTAGCLDPTYNGGIELNELGDTFLVQLDPSQPGSLQLAYSTYLGGALIDNGFAVALDPTGATGNVTVVGHCHSPGFPTTPGSLQPTINDPTPGDAFLCRIAPDGNGAADLLYGTFLGGSGFDYGYALALDAAGRAVIGGQAGITADFPVTAGAYDETHNGLTEGFVALVDPTIPGSGALLYSSHLGGTGRDTIYDLELTRTGEILLAGYSSSTDLPVSFDAFDTTYNGGSLDAFAARFTLLGGPDDLLWCSYLGGDGEDRAQRARRGPGGTLTLAGFTTSSDFPLSARGALGVDAFLVRFGANGTSIRSSRVFGGPQDDFGFGLALDRWGNAVSVGTSSSPAWPTTSGAYQANYGGGSADAFVFFACPEECAASAASWSSGRGVSGSLGEPQLRAGSRPSLGNSAFALELSGALANRPGVWSVHELPGSGGTVQASGLGRTVITSLPLTTDSAGAARLPWPVACSPRFCGRSVQVRALIQDPAAPGGWAKTKLVTVRMGS